MLEPVDAVYPDDIAQASRSVTPYDKPALPKLKFPEPSVFNACPALPSATGNFYTLSSLFVV